MLKQILENKLQDLTLAYVYPKHNKV